MANGTVLWKLGSSVLPTVESIGEAARAIGAEIGRGRKVVAVVSAVGDTTDRLLAEARSRNPRADEPALARFLATGEQQSAARLALALADSGHTVTVAEPFSIGLLADRDGLDAEPLSVDGEILRSLVDAHDVVVVPGFYGSRPGARIACFGRGGSDLSALVLAGVLRADCVLVKDVDGIYTENPNAPGSRAIRYERISFTTALRIGGGVVQEKTLRAARRGRRTLLVTSLGGSSGTLVAPGPDRLAPHLRFRPIDTRAALAGRPRTAEGAR